MLHQKSQDLILSFIGHLGMLGILCMAGYLWVERSTVFDNSLYSYMMILREGFYIPHDRRINYFWQWMPIVGLKFGVSLPTFLKLVSIAPVLFLYSLFVFVTHFLKHKAGGLYIVLVLVLLTRYKFYSAISEVYLSMAFVALMLAWMTVDREKLLWLGKRAYTILGMLILSLCYLGHPLIFFPLGVVIIFDYCMQQRWLSWNHMIWLASTLVLFVIKYLLTERGSYEGKVVEGFQQNTFSLDALRSTVDLYTMDIFWRYVETQWAFPLVVCLSMWIYVLVKKKFLAFACLVLSSIVWIVFVAQLNAYIDKPYLFMIEGYYGLWALIVLLPLVYIKIVDAKFLVFRNVLAVALIFFGLHRIASVGSFYTDRMEDMQQKMSDIEYIDSRNLVYDTSSAVWDKYWLIWSVPFETLFLSTLGDKEKSAVIVLDKKPDQHLLDTPFEIMIGTQQDSIKHLNARYFTIDSSPFIHMK